MAIRSLPETIKYLPRLMKLSIYNCELLQSIPALSRFIPKLVVWDCESLEKVMISMSEPYDEPNFCVNVLLNCKKLDPHSYQAVLKDTMDCIDVGARVISEIEDPFLYDRCRIFWNFLSVMPGMENWFHYSSKQVSVTLELPSNLLGFVYYLVLSQGHMGFDVGFGCECYLDNSSGERICIPSFVRGKFFKFKLSTDTSFHMNSDHVVLWYDPRSCKQIMDAVVEQTKAIGDVNNTSYNPKLTFTFFIDETLYDEVEIKECGFCWIYQEETESLSDFQSNDQEDVISPTNFEPDDLEETIPPRKKLQTDSIPFSVPALFRFMFT